MIRQLPQELRCRLRSGVAITHLTQCVEELVMNSLDAEANCVAVRIDLTCFKIQVVDNGTGISPDQLQVIGNRYFTSKCHSAEDLQNLHYFGYRGEALASLKDMAAIVEVTTRTRQSSQTYCKRFQRGVALKVFESTIHRPSAGTTFSVHDLFYNLPVRRKAMQESLELERIRHRMEGIALIHPNISFSLRSDVTGHVVLQTHKSSCILTAFTYLFGAGKAKSLCPVSADQDGFKVEGYIGKEPHYKKELQFIYINGRLVLKTKIHKLINRVLSKSLMFKRKLFTSECDPTVSGNSSPTKQNEKYSIFVLNVTCPLDIYDITFDPAKTLVEFKDWGTLTAFIETLVQNVLKKENLVSLADSNCLVFSPEKSATTIEGSNETQNSDDLVSEESRNNNDGLQSEVSGTDSISSETCGTESKKKVLNVETIGDGISTHNMIQGLHSKMVSRVKSVDRVLGNDDFTKLNNVVSSSQQNDDDNNQSDVIPIKSKSTEDVISGPQYNVNIITLKPQNGSNMPSKSRDGSNVIPSHSQDSSNINPLKSQDSVNTISATLQDGLNMLPSTYQSSGRSFERDASILDLKSKCLEAAGVNKAADKAHEVTVVDVVTTVGKAAIDDEVTTVGKAAIVDEVTAIGKAAVVDGVTIVGKAAVVDEVTTVGKAAVVDEARAVGGVCAVHIVKDASDNMSNSCVKTPDRPTVHVCLSPLMIAGLPSTNTSNIESVFETTENNQTSVCDYDMEVEDPLLSPIKVPCDEDGTTKNRWLSPEQKTTVKSFKEQIRQSLCQLYSHKADISKISRITLTPEKKPARSFRQKISENLAAAGFIEPVLKNDSVPKVSARVTQFAHNIPKSDIICDLPGKSRFYQRCIGGMDVQKEDYNENTCSRSLKCVENPVYFSVPSCSNGKLNTEHLHRGEPVVKAHTVTTQTSPGLNRQGLESCSRQGNFDLIVRKRLNPISVSVASKLSKLVQAKARKKGKENRSIEKEKSRSRFMTSASFFETPRTVFARLSAQAEVLNPNTQATVERENETMEQCHDNRIYTERCRQIGGEANDVRVIGNAHLTLPFKHDRIEQCSDNRLYTEVCRQFGGESNDVSVMGNTQLSLRIEQCCDDEQVMGNTELSSHIQENRIEQCYGRLDTACSRMTEDQLTSHIQENRIEQCYGRLDTACSRMTEDQLPSHIQENRIEQCYGRLDTACSRMTEDQLPSHIEENRIEQCYGRLDTACSRMTEDRLSSHIQENRIEQCHSRLDTACSRMTEDQLTSHIQENRIEQCYGRLDTACSRMTEDQLTSHIQENRIEQCYGRLDTACSRMTEDQLTSHIQENRIEQCYGRLDTACSRMTEDQLTSHIQENRIEQYHGRLDAACSRMTEDQLTSHIQENRIEQYHGRLDAACSRMTEDHSGDVDAQIRGDTQLTSHIQQDRIQQDRTQRCYGGLHTNTSRLTEGQSDDIDMKTLENTTSQNQENSRIKQASNAGIGIEGTRHSNGISDNFDVGLIGNTQLTSKFEEYDKTVQSKDDRQSHGSRLSSKYSDLTEQYKDDRQSYDHRMSLRRNDITEQFNNDRLSHDISLSSRHSDRTKCNDDQLHIEGSKQTGEGMNVDEMQFMGNNHITSHTVCGGLDSLNKTQNQGDGVVCSNVCEEQSHGCEVYPNKEQPCDNVTDERLSLTMYQVGYNRISPAGLDEVTNNNQNDKLQAEVQKLMQDKQLDIDAVGSSEQMVGMSCESLIIPELSHGFNRYVESIGSSEGFVLPQMESLTVEHAFKERNFDFRDTYKTQDVSPLKGFSDRNTYETQEFSPLKRFSDRNIYETQEFSPLKRFSDRNTYETQEFSPLKRSVDRNIYETQEFSPLKRSSDRNIYETQEFIPLKETSDKNSYETQEFSPLIDTSNRDECAYESQEFSPLISTNDLDTYKMQEFSPIEIGNTHKTQSVSALKGKCDRNTYKRRELFPLNDTSNNSSLLGKNNTETCNDEAQTFLSMMRTNDGSSFILETITAIFSDILNPVKSTSVRKCSKSPTEIDESQKQDFTNELMCSEIPCAQKPVFGKSYAGCSENTEASSLCSLLSRHSDSNPSVNLNNEQHTLCNVTHSPDVGCTHSLNESNRMDDGTISKPHTQTNTAVLNHSTDISKPHTQTNTTVLNHSTDISKPHTQTNTAVLNHSTDISKPHTQTNTAVLNHSTHISKPHTQTNTTVLNHSTDISKPHTQTNTTVLNHSTDISNTIAELSSERIASFEIEFKDLPTDRNVAETDENEIVGLEQVFSDKKHEVDGENSSVTQSANRVQKASEKHSTLFNKDNSEMWSPDSFLDSADTTEVTGSGDGVQVIMSSSTTVQNSVSDSAPQSIREKWKQVKDPKTETTLYVNILTGNTMSEADWFTLNQQEHDEPVADTSVNSGVVVSISTEEKVRLQEMVSSHLEETSTDRGVKWRTASDWQSSDSADISSLLSTWSNPVFEKPKQVALNAEVHHNTMSAARCFQSLYPTRFTKKMLQDVKVLGQIDNKFIACVFKTDEKNTSQVASLIVLVDQHAAHERVRLEQLTDDLYVDDDADDCSIKQFQVVPPKTLSVTDEEMRLLKSFRAEINRIGITFTCNTTNRNQVNIHSVPACIVEREPNELKRKRDSVAMDLVEVLLKDHIQLLKNTGGARSQLPQFLHKVLCSQACHGAVKFGDSLTFEQCVQLIDNLSTCSLPFQCAHGRPSVTPLIDLEHLKNKLPPERIRRPNLWKISRNLVIHQ